MNKVEVHEKLIITLLSYACLLVFLTILVFLIIGYLIVFLIAIKTQGIPL